MSTNQVSRREAMLRELNQLVVDAPIMFHVGPYAKQVSDAITKKYGGIDYITSRLKAGGAVHWDVYLYRGFAGLNSKDTRDTLSKMAKVLADLEKKKLVGIGTSYHLSTKSSKSEGELIAKETSDQVTGAGDSAASFRNSSALRDALAKAYGKEGLPTEDDLKGVISRQDPGEDAKFINFSMKVFTGGQLIIPDNLWKSTGLSITAAQSGVRTTRNDGWVAVSLEALGPAAADTGRYVFKVDGKVKWPTGDVTDVAAALELVDPVAADRYRQVTNPDNIDLIDILDAQPDAAAAVSGRSIRESLDFSSYDRLLLISEAKFKAQPEIIGKVGSIERHSELVLIAHLLNKLKRNKDQLYQELEAREDNLTRIEDRTFKVLKAALKGERVSLINSMISKWQTLISGYVKEFESRVNKDVEAGKIVIDLKSNGKIFLYDKLTDNAL